MFCPKKETPMKRPYRAHIVVRQCETFPDCIHNAAHRIKPQAERVVSMRARKSGIIFGRASLNA